jgi:polygalacturonase
MRFVREIKTLGFLLINLFAIAAFGTEPPPWAQVPEILARIQAPVFPARDFAITNFGAVADGKTDCTEAIGRAIDACAGAGGGRVVVPAGEFLTGAIHLKSNVNLHLTTNSVLKFKTDSEAYLPAVRTRFEGMECWNYSPLIYAYGQENIAVTGEGTLDGQADETHWWPWKGRESPGAQARPAAGARLVKMVADGAPVDQRRFGQGDDLRPSFIEPNHCRNVLIEGVHIRRSPMWEIHLLLCTNVTVRGVDIVSHGPNNDGCDPESCRDVLIEDCRFDTGDDCIAIKSGRNNDGRRVGVPSVNVIIRNCDMRDGHGGVTIGSEISGSCSNVFVEDCKMDSPNLARALRFKSNAMRGGVVQNIFMRNVAVGRVSDSVLQIDFLYEEGANGPYRPVARNIVMENITVNHAPRVLNVRGFPAAEISGVRIVNSAFKQVEKPDVVENADVKLLNCSIGSRN